MNVQSIENKLKKLLEYNDVKYHFTNGPKFKEFYLARKDILSLYNLVKVETANFQLIRRRVVNTLRYDFTDFEFIKALGFYHEQDQTIIIICDVDENGRWVPAYLEASISRIYPPLNSGGPYSDGKFFTEKAIIYSPSGKKPTYPDQECGTSITPNPIDIVYTWVDSNDEKWKSKKDACTHEESNLKSADHFSRYLSHDELRYSLRSVRKFAPWVRNIYLVTDEQTPRWFKDGKGLTIIDHKDIFGNQECLPVFNSHSIESKLHKIKGLSEFFIYFNDDVFLGNPVKPKHFFDKDGKVLIYNSRTAFIDSSTPECKKIPTDFAGYNMQDLFEEKFGVIPTRKMMHVPHPLRKTILEEISETFSSSVQSTMCSRIRSKSDIAIPSMVHPYYAWLTGRGKLRVNDGIRYMYFDLGGSNAGSSIRKVISKRPHMFCANATDNEYNNSEKQAVMLNKIYSMYPKKAPWED